MISAPFNLGGSGYWLSGMGVSFPPRSRTLYVRNGTHKTAFLRLRSGQALSLHPARFAGRRIPLTRSAPITEQPYDADVKALLRIAVVRSDSLREKGREPISSDTTALTELLVLCQATASPQRSLPALRTPFFGDMHSAWVFA